MKIAVLVYRLNGIGGIAKHALLLCRELVEMGHEVDVWAVEYDPALCYPELTHGLNVRALRAPHPPSPDQYRLPAGRRMLSYLSQLWQAYQDQQNLFTALPPSYDVLNPHGDHVQWAAAAYKNRYRLPAVWMCNDFWPPAQQIEMASSIPGTLKQWAKQVLVFPFERYDHWAVHLMDSIVVLSERVQAQMKDYYEAQSVVVRTGISAPESTSVPLANHQSSVFELLTVCTLMPRRRIEDVIDALACLRQEGVEIRYTIVGRTDHTPSYTASLHNHVAQRGLGDNVIFTGEVSDEALSGYFEACDAFVWSAGEDQSWGMACMEAMAYGKPVLCSTANGLAEVLRDEENALLFPPGALEALAASIKRLASDPALSQSLAVQGRKLVLEQYSWRRNAEAMLSLFTAAQQDDKSRLRKFPALTAFR